MAELIKHKGIVLAKYGDTARIEIVQTSACSTCAARKMCMSSESQRKELDALMLEPMEVGDRVEVMVTEKLGWKAILLAYIMPFVVMMGSISILNIWLDSETIVGTVSLCMVAVYYVILSFFRRRLQKQFSFTVHKLYDTL